MILFRKAVQLGGHLASRLSELSISLGKRFEYLI